MVLVQQGSQTTDGDEGSIRQYAWCTESEWMRAMQVNKSGSRKRRR